MKRARMAKTLGCLVAAMTIGAAGLMWIEPHTAHLYPDNSARISEPYLLRARPAATVARWQGLIIEHRFDLLGSLPLSSHAAELGRHHFIVDADGFRQVCPAWRSQSDLPDSKGLIRVAVQAQPNAPTISAQQWQSLLTLLRFLEDRCRLEGAYVQLRAHPAPASPALKQQARRLAAMLRAVGLF